MKTMMMKMRLKVNRPMRIATHEVPEKENTKTQMTLTLKHNR